MKDIRFCGHSLVALRGFPVVAKREAGYQLDRVQHGLEPSDWKSMPSIGSGVREIRIVHEGQFRVIYIAKLADASMSCTPSKRRPKRRGIRILMQRSRR